MLKEAKHKIRAEALLLSQFVQKRKWLVIGCMVAIAIVMIAIPRPLSLSSAASSKKLGAATTTLAKSVSKATPKATIKPLPTPTQAAKVAATPSPTLPSSILNLTNWELTLPIGNAEIISQPQLATFTDSYFQVNNPKNGVVFQAPVDGSTTTNSNYPRSELREMTAGGTQPASWSDNVGTNSMSITEAITHLPVVKPSVVAGQIHNASDDVVMVYLDGSVLYVENNGNNIGTLNANYALGTVFTVQLVATGGHIDVYYNGTKKVDYAVSGSGYYFKAGCYTQSNPSKGDSPGAYGQVIIYGLQISHTQ